MARKTTESTTTNRSKKIATPAQPVVEQIAAQVQKDVPKEARKASPPDAVPGAIKAVGKNGKSVKNTAESVPAVVVPAVVVSAVVEEEIRRRAYELYLQRKSTVGNVSANGNGSGDENQDWLIAEREIRSRLGNQGHHSA